MRCTAGAIFDVAVDLRPASSTFRGWFGVELSAENRLALYVPEGCAHGFLTLADDVGGRYQISAPHVAGAARGVRFDDPAFGIAWPGDVVVINERDRSYPDFESDAGVARDAPTARRASANGAGERMHALATRALPALPQHHRRRRSGDAPRDRRAHPARGARGAERDRGSRLDRPGRVEHPRRAHRRRRTDGASSTSPTRISTSSATASRSARR